MDLSVFEKMEKPELLRYLGFLLWHYRVVDGFWFLNVEGEHGRASAEAINARVWDKCAELAARKIRNDLGHEETGLSGFLSALRLFPWTSMVGYEIEERPGELYISAPRCPPQVARIARGIGEYECREMHRGEFSSFAKVIDPRIRVECCYAPPDPHPPECFCRWRFTIGE